MPFLGNAIRAGAHTLPPIAPPAQEQLRDTKEPGKGSANSAV